MMKCADTDSDATKLMQVQTLVSQAVTLLQQTDGVDPKLGWLLEDCICLCDSSSSKNSHKDVVDQYAADQPIPTRASPLNVLYRHGVIIGDKYT